MLPVEGLHDPAWNKGLDQPPDDVFVNQQLVGDPDQGGPRRARQRPDPERDGMADAELALGILHQGHLEGRQGVLEGRAGWDDHDDRGEPAAKKRSGGTGDEGLPHPRLDLLSTTKPP